MATDRTPIGRGLAVRRRANRPPWRWLHTGHRPYILAPTRGGRARAAGDGRAGHRPRASTIAAGLLVGAVGAVGIGLAAAAAGAAARTQRERRAARRSRRFGLLAGESPADGLPRIALAQLDIAIGLLRGEAPAGAATSSTAAGLAQEEAVHEARKTFKRLRALVRLLEGELGEAQAARELEILRDAGRQLAGARDAEVLVATIDAVLRDAPRKLGRRRAVRELRARLERERRRATRQLLTDRATRARVTRELEDMRARVVGTWRLPSHDATALALELTGPGLRRIYRAGARARRRARRAGGRKDARALHRWRTHAKELRYALEALTPEEDPAGKRIAKAAKRADALGELLGEDHDLVVLAERVRATTPAPKRRHRRHLSPKRRRRARQARRARKRLLKEIARRRAKLRKRALRAGDELYERKPARFVRDLRP